MSGKEGGTEGGRQIVLGTLRIAVAGCTQHCAVADRPSLLTSVLNELHANVEDKWKDWSIFIYYTEALFRKRHFFVSMAKHILPQQQLSFMFLSARWILCSICG